MNRINKTTIPPGFNAKEATPFEFFEGDSVGGDIEILRDPVSGIIWINAGKFSWIQRNNKTEKKYLKPGIYGPLDEGSFDIETKGLPEKN